MQFKEFEANDMREALLQIKQAMGPDAIIVATREIPGYGLFKKRRLVVTAGLEEPQVNQQTPATVLHDRVAAAQPKVPVHAGVYVEEQQNLFNDMLREFRSAVQSTQKNQNELVNKTLGQFSELRQMLSTLPKNYAEAQRKSPLDILLEAADVEEHVATEVVKKIYSGTSVNPYSPWPQQIDILKNVLADSLQTQTNLFVPGKPQRVALVGPTGVGKTTTIAKIAAHAVYFRQRSVALISLDTYRVAAFEQLKQYAWLIGIPMALARDAASLAQALYQYRHTDLILLDTAGRSLATDSRHREELRQMFAGQDINIHLTLAATTRKIELVDVLQAFDALNPSSLIFTKIDEAMALGAIVNASSRCCLPISFITDGQRVPEDLAEANAFSLVDKLVDRALKMTKQAGQLNLDNWRAPAVADNQGQHAS